MIDRIKIMHNGKTLEVLKNDVSKKIWQELKDNRPLTTADNFRPKTTSSFKSKERKLDLVDNFVFGIYICTIIYFSAYLIYYLL